MTRKYWIHSLLLLEIISTKERILNKMLIIVVGISIEGKRLLTHKKTSQYTLLRHLGLPDSLIPPIVFYLLFLLSICFSLSLSLFLPPSFLQITDITIHTHKYPKTFLLTFNIYMSFSFMCSLEPYHLIIIPGLQMRIWVWKVAEYKE